VPTSDYAAIYRGVRERVTGLVDGLPDEVLNGIAPATPEWMLRDIVAHLSGITADIVAGNMAGVTGAQWTQAQVDARRDVALSDVLDEWARCAAIVEPGIAGAEPMMRRMLLTDAVTHELDLRGALGNRDGRDTDALDYGFQGVSRGIGSQREDAGALRIVHEAGDTVVGTGDARATLRVTRFEVLRAAVGRRSPEQIEAWEWDGEALPATVVLPMFSPPRATPLEE
jgi:uncharacterized protein (TIGR03083 family)